jgi:hypothetical protein
LYNYYIFVTNLKTQLTKMKKIYLLFLLLTTYLGANAFDVTFSVDMNGTGLSNVSINGTFNNWCGYCAPMTDANSDGVWEITLPLGAGTYEYKFTANSGGSWENLAPGSSCTVTNFGFTNRSLAVTANATLPVVCWQSCVSCSQAPASYPVTFKVDMANVTGFTTPTVNGSFDGWCGNCHPMTDANADGIWETTLSLPAGTYEYKFAYDNWAGQETLIAGSTCTVTNSGYTNRTVTVSAAATLPTVCWASCLACAQVPPSYTVTFKVNMQGQTGFTTPEVNGTFNGWCGNCNPLTDANADGIWETTLTLQGGTYEYKFSADGWGSQENLTAGSSCTVTDNGYTNRALNLNANTTLDIVCWGSCTNCAILGCTSATACNYNALATEDDGSCQFIPTIPAVVTGEVYACAFLTGGTTTYSTPAVANTTFQWIAPAGMTIVSGQGTNTITVSFGSAFITSSLKVRAVTTCGASLYKLFQVKRVAPARPTALTAPATKACPGDVVVYTATAMAGATSYNWTAPTGATVTAGQGTNIATITFNSGFTASGVVSVTASNGCGVSLAKTKAIALNTIPLTPSVITGTRTVSQNQTAVPYSVVNVAGVTYNWTIAANLGTIASGQGSNAITVNASNIIGTGYTMSVTASNGCGTSPVRAITNLKIVAGVSALELAETPSTELEKTEVVSAANMTVFPNPASDIVTLQMENIEEGTVAQITIFDLTGKQVFNMQSTSNLQILDVSQFAKGMYVIQVNTANQNFVQKLQVK